MEIGDFEKAVVEYERAQLEFNKQFMNLLTLLTVQRYTIQQYGLVISTIKSCTDIADVRGGSQLLRS